MFDLADAIVVAWTYPRSKVIPYRMSTTMLNFSDWIPDTDELILLVALQNNFLQWSACYQGGQSGTFAAIRIRQPWDTQWPSGGNIRIPTTKLLRERWFQTRQGGVSLTL